MDVIIARPLALILRWLGARTILSLALLLMALVSVALGLADLIRGLEAALLLPVAVIGALLGWVMAWSPIPGWLAAVIGVILGIEAVFVRVGRMSQQLTSLVQSLAEMIWRGVRWPIDGVPPDASSVVPALSDLGSTFRRVLSRLSEWSQAVINGQAAFDPVAVPIVWSLTLWMAAVWAGWALRRRHQPLHAVVPAGALLAISLSYTWGNPIHLQALLGATLLLMLLTAQIVREHRWEAAGMDFSPELRVDLAAVAIPIWLALMAVIILVPSVSLRPLAEAGQRWILENLGGGKQVADSMGLEPLAGPGVALDRARAAGLPNQSLIGSGPELSEKVVMLVSTGELPPAPTHLELPSTIPRHYWRALTYDGYTGRGWSTGPTEKVAYLAGEPIKLRYNPNQESATEPAATETTHRTLRQTVQIIGGLGGLLYASGELVTADYEFNVAWRSPEDVFGAEIEATAYRADSLVSVASEAQLRTAGSNYPEWVEDRYLALPPEVPTRVLSLARDLTSGEPTSYDQARAIESYLRTFTYTLDLPAPPPNRDVADYFLFDLQQGYCDYYATTMVVLARAAGLPSRLAVGYVSGIYDPENARYVVAAADAHSWVEVYFPGYGWVEFEPTGGRPPIERPSGLPELEIPEPQTPLEPAANQPLEPHQLFWLGALGVLVFMVLGGLAWWSIDSWRLQRLPPAATVSALYQRLYGHGRRLAVPIAAGDTPYEFAVGLTERVIHLAKERRTWTALAPVFQYVQLLTDLYVGGLYSPREPSAVEKAQAITTWKQLRPYLWLAWVWHKRKSLWRGG